MSALRKSSEEFAGAVDEANLAFLRELEERRLLAALHTWEAEKKRLEEAIAWGEAKEREFREISDDVKRRIEALELVASMNRASQPELAAQPNQCTATVPENTPVAPEVAPVPEPRPIDSKVRRSWRPLFSAGLQSAAAGLSILQ